MNTINRKLKSLLWAFIACLVPATGFSINQGNLAPDFTVEHILDDTRTSLSQYKGKVVYLDFWASWCAPCLKSFSFMDELQKQFGEDGFVVIAVNLDANSEDARQFLNKTPAGFFVGQNAQGDIAEDYGVTTMPSTYLIGRDGLIKAVHHGFRSRDRDKIKALVKDLL